MVSRSPYLGLFVSKYGINGRVFWHAQFEAMWTGRRR